MCSFDLERLIDSPTCYKSINPTCIDLILTNKKNHFMKFATFETGLSDHHKLITTILRKTISKGNSKKMFYRDYKRFDQKKFETELKLKLNSQTNLSYFTFQAVFLEILNKIAPVEIKVLRFYNNAFMTKSLRKAIMLRSKLKNNFNKGLMKTGTIIRSKGIFVLNYSTRPKKNILVILMSKVFLTTKNSGRP